MNWTADRIARILQQNTFKAHAVIPNCYWPGDECDLLVVDDQRRLLDVEIKISRADFKADAAKSKWWDRVRWNRPDVGGPREWPRRVARHYFAMPADIWKDDLVKSLPSQACGIILVGKHSAWVERRAKANPEPYVLTADDLHDLLRASMVRIWSGVSLVDDFIGPPLPCPTIDLGDL